MLILGLGHLEDLISGRRGSAKMVFNATGAIFLPTTSQHRDSKAEGISYEDNHKGNALAAMLAPGRIEVRFHAAYPPDEVAGFLAGAFATPELGALRAWSVTYKGKPLSF